MSKINSEFTILWISDIHFRLEYGRNGSQIIHQLSEILEPMIKSLEGVSISIILISGDIASKGIEEEFALFDKFILKPILEVISCSPKILMVPGNHDVQIKEASFLSRLYEQILQNGFDKVKINALKNEYLQKKEYFLPIFQNYLNYLKRRGEKEIQPLACPLTFYYLDHDNQVIFFLLNTSWFALGKQYNEVLTSIILDDDAICEDDKDIHDNNNRINLNENNIELSNPKKLEKILRLVTKKTLDFKEALVEYGGQKIGINKEMIAKFEGVIEKYPNYLCITCGHHPNNWLDVFEKYDLNSDKLLNLILNKSHLHLSSHEHVASTIPYEILHGKAVHLKSGMLLQDDIRKELYGENRYSILRINSQSKEILEEKYIYDEKARTWKNKIEVSEGWLKLPFRRQAFSTESLWVNTNFSVNFNFEKFINLYCPELGGKKIQQRVEKLFNHYFLEEPNKHFIFPTSNIFWEHYLQNIEDSNNLFNELISRSNEEGTKITLLFFDFLISKSVEIFYNEELKKSNSRSYSSCFHIICDHFYTLFDEWRHRYFIQFNFNKMNLKDSPHTREVLEKTRKAVIAIQIVPFWDIPKYLDVNTN